MNHLESKLEAEYKYAKKWCIVSAIWFFIGFIGIWGGESSDLDYLDYILFCLTAFMGVGAWGFWYGYMKQERIKKVQHYMQVLANESTGSFGSIASRMGIPQEQVKGELKDLIHRGYFKNAHINNQTNCVVICDEENGIVTGQPLSPSDMEIIRCSCCVGINKVPKGMAALCDFCGMPLKE